MTTIGEGRKPLSDLENYMNYETYEDTKLTCEEVNGKYFDLELKVKSSLSYLKKYNGQVCKLEIFMWESDDNHIDYTYFLNQDEIDGGQLRPCGDMFEDEIGDFEYDVLVKDIITEVYTQ